MKDIRTLLLALLSAGLIGTWVYHLYDKTQYSQRRTEVYIKDSIAVAQGVQDSLQRLYASTIRNLDSKLDSTRTNADSLKYQLEARMGEIYQLKKEIDGILKNRGATKEDLALARVKITELQTLVDDLETRKLTMEEEKEALTKVMSQLSGEITGLHENMKKLGEENRVLTEKVNLASVFVASEIQFSPVTVKGDKETETNQAKKAGKFVISFSVQNNLAEYDIAEVYIVITQPNGSIVTNDDLWETSGMALANGNRINYSRKVRFEYQKGEVRKLIFSINAEEYNPGTYTLQIYHRGHMIGQVMKTLV
jgi:hypothetical protein